jgi:hypothetical protein
LEKKSSECVKQFFPIGLTIIILVDGPQSFHGLSLIESDILSQLSIDIIEEASEFLHAKLTTSIMIIFHKYSFYELS